jgi:hypothetical protein
MTIVLKKNGQLVIDSAQPLEGKDANLDNLAAFIADPQDGNAIVYNAAKGIWEAGEVSGGGGGGSGGGMVVEINAVDGNMVMNHTWKEIHDAIPVMPVAVFANMPTGYAMGYISTVAPPFDPGGNYTIAICIYVMGGDEISFVTDNEDGYPSAPMGQ